MSELTARLSLYGEVDDAVQRPDGPLVAAASVIPAYRIDLDPPAESTGVLPTAGWFAAFNRVVPEFERLDVDAALAELAVRRQPTELQQAHRLRTLLAVARVLPETIQAEHVLHALVPVVDPDAPAPTVRSIPSRTTRTSRRSTRTTCRSRQLPDVEPPTDEQRERSIAALDHLTDVDRFPTIASWPDLVDSSSPDSCSAPSVAKLRQDRVRGPDRLRSRRPTRPSPPSSEPAARIVTSVGGFPIGSMTLDDVATKLRPPHWPACLKSFWCAMRDVDPPTNPKNAARVVVPGGRRVTCPNVWFDPHLRFFTRDLVDASGVRNGIELQYDLCDAADIAVIASKAKAKAPNDDPPAQDARVEVDIGVLRANVDPGAGTRRREPPLDLDEQGDQTEGTVPTGGVAILACVTGWADQTRVMITGCLASP